MIRLNLGSGNDIRDGYYNIDRSALPGVDVVTELDDPDKVSLPFDDDSVDEFIAVDLIEHIVHPLPLMAELWRCAKPDAILELALPYGTSDDAWEDPTHVRPYFVGSWRYFSAPIFYRADYGYRGDWEVEQIILDVADSPATSDELAEMLLALRNVVLRQYVRLRAVKPARTPDAEKVTQPPVLFRKVAQ
jgi:SAM-dependent methyltransferase